MFKNPKFLIILPVILIGGLIFSSYFIWQNNSNKSPLWGVPRARGVLPLIADSEHDVAVIEECDLAIRFDKNKYGLKLKMSKNFNDKDVIGILLNDSKYIYENELIYTEFIYCEPYQKQSQDKSDISPYKSKLFKNLLDSVDTFGMNRVIVSSSSDCVGVNYTIIHKTNFYYLRDDISPVSLDCALFPDGKFSDMFRQYNLDLLQIQFNSLAPSTPSVKL